MLLSMKKMASTNSAHLAPESSCHTSARGRTRTTSLLDLQPTPNKAVVPLHSTRTMFHEHVSTLLNEYIATLSDRTLPVVDLASPNDLTLAFANVGVATSLLDLQPTPNKAVVQPTNSGPHTNEALLRAVQLILTKSVRTGHPQFYNQLYGRYEFTF